MPICSCPISSALTAITVNACKEDIGQIQKILFQRKFSTGTTLNTFVIGTTNPNVLATWTTVTTATDGTKVVVSPYIQAPETEAGAAVTYGGGNATLGGVAEIVGRESTKFTAELLWKHQSVVTSLKNLQCEDIAIYLIDEYGQIIGLADDNTSATNFYPIPVRAFFVGDKTFGGFENPDKNMISWEFAPNWSDQLYVITPATGFDPLADIG